MADELPHHGRHIADVKEGFKLLERIREENRVKGLLKDAIEARDLHALTSAVTAAESLELSCNELDDARSLIERLNLENEVRSGLREAIAARDKARLVELLDKAVELDIDSDEVKQVPYSLCFILFLYFVSLFFFSFFLQKKRCLSVKVMQLYVFALFIIIKKANALKVRLEEEEETIEQLKAAMESRSLNELNAFLAKMTELGLDNRREVRRR